METHPLIVSLLSMALVAGPAFAATPALKTQTLCGWFQNPTPANAWLQDRTGEWIISTQGGRQADGNWPDFTDSQWVQTNGYYGYGCACIKAVVNIATHDVISISSAKAESLNVCKKDRTLKAPVQ